jgi:hypothetical protein
MPVFSHAKSGASLGVTTGGGNNVFVPGGVFETGSEPIRLPLWQKNPLAEFCVAGYLQGRQFALHKP